MRVHVNLAELLRKTIESLHSSVESLCYSANEVYSDRVETTIVKLLKEFKGMLLGQRITVWTDHQNLIRDSLNRDCDRVMS